MSVCAQHCHTTVHHNFELVMTRSGLWKWAKPATPKSWSIGGLRFYTTKKLFQLSSHVLCPDKAVHWMNHKERRIARRVAESNSWLASIVLCPHLLAHHRLLAAASAHLLHAAAQYRCGKQIITAWCTASQSSSCTHPHFSSSAGYPSMHAPRTVSSTHTPTGADG